MAFGIVLEDGKSYRTYLCDSCGIEKPFVALGAQAYCKKCTIRMVDDLCEMLGYEVAKKETPAAD